MTNRGIHGLHTQLFRPNARRNQDRQHWWQLPGDPTRVDSRWRQPLVDILAPATFSEWHEKIALHRVTAYDLLRPAMTRLLYMAVIVTALAIVGASWWCWALLTGAVQIPLEIYLQKYHMLSGREPTWQLGRWMSDVASRHFQTVTLNAGGIAGAVACPLNIIAAYLAPPGGSHGWIKVASLAAALIYLNSGLANVFLDPPNYTENSIMPPFMHAVRAYVPLISLIVVAAIIAVSETHARWESDMVPIAFMCTTVTLLLGSWLRDHDRMVAAAAHVGRQAVEAGRRDLGGIVHDELSPAKAVAESASRLPGLPLPQVVELQALSAFLTHFGTRASLFDAQRMDLGYLVNKIAAPYGISPHDIGCKIGWDPAALRREDHHIALRMATAPVHNLGQTLSRPEHHYAPKSFVVEAFTTGTGGELRYHLAVRDYLPPIVQERWCVGGTLDALRSWLRETFTGDLAQQGTGDGTKRIVASWGGSTPIIWKSHAIVFTHETAPE